MINRSKKTYDSRRVYCSCECAERAKRLGRIKAKRVRYQTDAEYRDKIKRRQREYNKTDAGRAAAQRGKFNRDKRIKDGSDIDKDIDVHKLYDRDGGVCWICGGVCNWDDCEEKISKSGKLYLATMSAYPTIDHVVPLSKGGTHTWDNVKLAHKGCNISKGNKIL